MVILVICENFWVVTGVVRSPQAAAPQVLEAERAAPDGDGRAVAMRELETGVGDGGEGDQETSGGEATAEDKERVHVAL